jgi:hypothetical protein
VLAGTVVAAPSSGVGAAEGTLATTLGPAGSVAGGLPPFALHAMPSRASRANDVPMAR